MNKADRVLDQILEQEHEDDRGGVRFTHAKVSVRFVLHGASLPPSPSGVEALRPFFGAAESAALLPLYATAGIVEVGAPTISYKRHCSGVTASCVLECWVYGALVGGHCAAVFVEAIKACRDRLPSGDSWPFAGDEGVPWRVERLTGPRTAPDPVAGSTEFRVGVHAQKHKHRSSERDFPPGAVASLRGFDVADLAKDKGVRAGGKRR